MRISDWSSDVCSSDLEMHDRGGDLYRWPFASSGETSCQRERTKADLAQGNSQRNQFVDTFPLFRQFCCSNHLRYPAALRAIEKAGGQPDHEHADQWCVNKWQPRPLSCLLGELR